LYDIGACYNVSTNLCKISISLKDNGGDYGFFKAAIPLPYTVLANIATDKAEVFSHFYCVSFSVSVDCLICVLMILKLHTKSELLANLICTLASRFYAFCCCSVPSLIVGSRYGLKSRAGNNK
jgi:hypothetical protein